METKLLKANKKSIDLAISLLKQGEVVGVPTETVYGLAGDCANPNAIKKIFEAKGRPGDNPLIVHISNCKMLEGIVSYVSNDAKKLMKHFWPGPLTIIMPKGDRVCSESCAGLDSVGVRMPQNKIAKQIIKKSNIAFSAPSANLSGKPSPTKAKAVYDDMKGRIPLIIDGGECINGVESTVISVLNDIPIILRPGVITKENIENVLNKPVMIAKGVTEMVDDNKKVLSPGMKYKHYAPNATIVVVKSSLEKFIQFVNSKQQEKGIFAMCFDGEEKNLKVKYVTYGRIEDEKAQAHNLFHCLRQLDELGAKTVYARCPLQKGIALAVYNRLIRSAGFYLIEI